MTKQQQQQAQARSSSSKKPIERLLDAAVARAAPLSILLLIGGLVGFAAVPALERPIEFDENALLAGSARPTIRTGSGAALDAAEALAAALAPHYQTPQFRARLIRAMRHELGLEAYRLPFAVAAPRHHSGSGSSWAAAAAAATANATDGTAAPLACETVAGVLRSPRGDGKECLVLVTPINMQAFAPPDFAQTADGASLAVAAAAALLSHLRAAPWLAKDVVWVASDASCGVTEGVAAWVAAYQGTPAPRHVRALAAAAKPPVRAGLMQQAVVLEAATGAFDAFDLPLPGYDGQLPKLDMYWLLKYYVGGWVAAPLVGELPPPPSLLPSLLSGLLWPESAPAGAAAAARHARRLQTFAAFAWQQARGLPRGPHAPFRAASADAVTLRLLRLPGDGGGSSSSTSHASGDEWPRPASPPLAGRAALEQLGEALELAFRSCSGLIERFHHSFFLYALTSPTGFVAVDAYIGPAAALIAVLALQAAADNRRALGDDDGKGAGGSGSSGGGWGAAARGVLLAHAAGAAMGAALRYVPPALLARPREAAAALLPLLLPGGRGARHHPSGVVAAAGGGGDAGWAAAAVALGAGLLLALGTTSDGSSSVGSGNDSSTSSGDNAAAARAALCRRMRVLQLSGAAAALAAMACLNWALAFFLAAALAPLSVACAPPPSGRRRMAALATWLLLSPPTLLAAAHAAVAATTPFGMQAPQAAAAAAGWHERLERWLSLESSDTAYALWWALYVPFWGVHGFVSLLGGRRAAAAAT